MEPSAATPPNWHACLAANASRYLLFARAQTRREANAQDVLQDALVESLAARVGPTAG